MSADPYNALVRKLFAETMHAGSLADASSVERHEQGVRIEMFATGNAVAAGSLRFRAYSCPHFIAAAEMVCAQYEGQPASQLESFSAAELMQSLAVPMEKSGRILVLEDTVRMLGAALRESSSPTEQD